MGRTDLTSWEAFLRDPCEETFPPIYERTNALVWTICLRILRTEEDAADALQGAYARLLGWARDPVDPPASAGPERVMRRLAVLEADRLRKRRSRRLAKEVPVSELPLTPDHRPRPDREVATQEMRELLEDLISELPERYRVPLLLHFFHGMTHREIAEALDKPPTTVSSQIQRGLRKLEPKARRAGLRDARGELLAVAAVAALIPPPPAFTPDLVFRAGASMGAAVRPPHAQWADSSTAVLAASYAVAVVLVGLPVLLMWPSGDSEEESGNSEAPPAVLVIHHDDPTSMADDLEAARLESRSEADLDFPVPAHMQRMARNLTTAPE